MFSSPGSMASGGHDGTHDKETERDYIYIYIEREREMYIYIYIHMIIVMMIIIIYIYICIHTHVFSISISSSSSSSTSDAKSLWAEYSAWPFGFEVRFRDPRLVPCYRHRLNGYLANGCLVFFLRAVLGCVLNCEFLEDMFPWRTRYP